MENQLVKIVNESGLEQTKAQVILNNFSNYFDIAADWENKAKMLIVTDPNQKAEMKMAREGRLFLKEKRVSVENTRKQLKEQSLREGQTIDAIAKILKNLIEPIEDHLEKQEKFIEIKEAEKKQERKEKRIEILTSLEFDFTYTDLLNMPDEQFEVLVLKLENERDAKIAAEKKAEQERIEKEKAEAAENERIRVDNERLKHEAIEREKAAKIEAEKQAKIQAELKAKAEAEKIEREKAETILKAKVEAEKAEQLRIEREAKEKEKAEKKAANAPDKSKLQLFAAEIKSIKYPDLKGDEANKILLDVDLLLKKVVNFINEKADLL